MTDPLVQQLTRELGLRATHMSGDITLAPRVLEKAHTVRRRRAFVGSVTAAAAVAALVFVTMGPALHLSSGRSPSPGPATGSSTKASSQVTPPAGPITVGYAVNGLLRPDGSRARTVVVLGSGATAGSSIRLPQHWVVSRVGRSGPGLVVLGSIVESSTGNSETGSALAAYISPAGQVTKLRHLARTSFPTDRDGTVWVTVTLSATRAAEWDLSFVRPETDTIVERAPALSSDLVTGLVGAVGPRSAFFGGGQVWSSGDGAAPGLRLKDVTPLWHLLATDVGGAVLLSDPDGLRLVRTDGSKGWTKAVAQQGFAAHFSPDGSRIEISARSGPTVVSAADGSTIANGLQTDVGPDYYVAWEDAETVLVVSAADVGSVSHVVRCSALSGRCTPLADPKGILVLAGR